MKFSRFKTLDQIRAQCAELGIELDSKLYDQSGWDYVSMSIDGYFVIYNPLNGHFHGKRPNGMAFSYTDQLDGTPWFDDMLKFFFSEPEEVSQ